MKKSTMTNLLGRRVNTERRKKQSTIKGQGNVAGIHYTCAHWPLSLWWEEHITLRLRATVTCRFPQFILPKLPQIAIYLLATKDANLSKFHAD